MPCPSSHHTTSAGVADPVGVGDPVPPGECRRGTGLRLNERDSTAADGERMCWERAWAWQRFPGGYKKPLLLCISRVDATHLLLWGRGTFQAVYSSWRAGRGGATYKLLQIIDLKITACPPTHPQTQRPVLPLKGDEWQDLPVPPDPDGQDGERCPPRSGSLTLPLSSPADSEPSAAVSGCAQLQRWVLYTWANANLEKPAHLVNTLHLLEDIIRPA